MRVVELEQQSFDWYKIKLGKITGSRSKKVFSSNNLTFVDELISEVGTEEIEEGFSTPDTERGNKMENVAASEYERLTNQKTEVVGFCIHDQYDWLGLSPDRLIIHDGLFKKGVEIKCPKTKTHVKYIRQNKIPAEYKYQIYHYFTVVDELEEVDFVSYDDRFKAKPIHIITVKRSEIKEELEEYKQELIKFYNKFQKLYNQIIF